MGAGMKNNQFKQIIAAFKNAIKDFDPRSLNKLTNASAAEDLNHFLEKMPQNASQTMLVIAGVVWMGAAAVGLFTVVNLQSLTQLRTELQEAEAIKPSVPKIVNQAVKPNDLKKFAERMKDIYQGVDIKASGTAISMTASSTNTFGQFREAIGHVQNGGDGWRIDIKSLCVGRECEGKPLSTTLKINTISVKPK